MADVLACRHHSLTAHSWTGLYLWDSVAPASDELAASQHQWVLMPKQGGHGIPTP